MVREPIARYDSIHSLQFVLAMHIEIGSSKSAT